LFANLPIQNTVSSEFVLQGFFSFFQLLGKSPKNKTPEKVNLMVFITRKFTLSEELINDKFHKQCFLQTFNDVKHMG
jgi:hypothetical protein